MAQPQGRLPITDGIMLVIFKSLSSTYDHIIFWAACTLTYFGFLRLGEFMVPSLECFSADLHLVLDDIAVDSQSSPFCMRVRIKVSKPDPFRKGCYIHIGTGNYPLCAVRATMAYLQLRGSRGGPLFLKADCLPLSRLTLIKWLQECLSSSCIPGNFSNNSFHIGAVAARNGIPDHLIQALGRYSSNI